jgi:hypothetical protein
MSRSLSTSEDSATIVVENQRPWFGDQRLGAFHLYIDGVRVGAVLPTEALSFEVAPGGHMLRIRRWWYYSPQMRIEISTGQALRVKADILRSGSLLRRFIITSFTPWRSLVLSDIS